MIGELRARVAHFFELWRVGLWGLWFWGLYGVVGLFVLWRDEFWRPADPEKWRLVALIPHLNLAWWCAITLGAVAVWLFEASYRKQRGMLDHGDVQRLLGGAFLGRTFLYGAEITVCKNYRNGFEVEHLKAGFDPIPVRAPANSVATIKLQFMNTRGNSGNFKFYVRDGRGRESEFANIYEPLDVRLDGSSQFGLRLVCHDDYRIIESASLMVSVEGWRR